MNFGSALEFHHSLDRQVNFQSGTLQKRLYGILLGHASYRISKSGGPLNLLPGGIFGRHFQLIRPRGKFIDWKPGSGRDRILIAVAWAALGQIQFQETGVRLWLTRLAVEDAHSHPRGCGIGSINLKIKESGLGFRKSIGARRNNLHIFRNQRRAVFDQRTSQPQFGCGVGLPAQRQAA